MRINSHVALHKIALVRLLHFVIPIVAFTSVAFTTGAVLTLAHAGTPTYTTFAVQGAGTGDFLGTFPISIAPDGTVVGFFSRQTVDRAGFLRDPRGNITLIDAPNAGTAPHQGTHGYSVAPDGTISGWYFDAYFVAHGFVRTPEGIITVVDMPGAGNGAFQGTFSWWPAITPSGTITGYLIDENYVNHGFLRDLGGGFTVFDVPEASNAGGGTQALAISTAGVITGNYFDVNGIGHGFIRSKHGTITTFDVPGAALGTFPNDINPSGAIAGFYFDANGTQHCFVRAKDGAITPFDFPPDAPAGSMCQSAYIAPDGTVAAFYYDPNGVGHPFLRDHKGAMSNFDVPGAVNGAGVSSIGANGVVVGNYIDSGFTSRGYIRTP
jgi:hypothetical protein